MTHEARVDGQEVRIASLDPDGVAFLVAEFNNQYEQFRHRDHLRVSYLQIYFSLATVVLTGTGLVLSKVNVPLLVLVAVGYSFLFLVGQLATKMMVALRIVQLRTAVLLDLIRTYLGRRLEVLPALIDPGGMQSHPFFEANASSTWVFKFVSVLNGFFLTCSGGFVAAALFARFGLQPRGWGLAVLTIGFLFLLGLTVAVTTGRNQRHLRDQLLGLRSRLDLERLYALLEDEPATR